MRPTILFVSVLLAACGTSNTPSPDASTQDVPVDASADVVTDVAKTDAAQDAAPLETHYAWEPVELPAEGPLERWGYMVASAGGGAAYVYGGTNLTLTGAGAVDNALWRWDGAADPPTFTAVTTTGAPPRRYCGCIGYVPDAHRLVMVGGRTPEESPAETWTLDTETNAWTRSSTTTTPDGVIGCQMAWSQSRGAMYLFGGCSSAGCQNHTWRYDAAMSSWVQLMATGPRARYDDAMVPIGDGRQLVMFGGARSATGSGNFFHDVWLFDTMAETWSEVMVEGDTPAGRRTPWVSVDADGRGMLVGFGATGLQATNVLNDLWHLDLDAHTWTALTPDGDAPPARGFVAALPATGEVRGALMGGFDNREPVRDLWRLRVTRR